MFLAQKQQIVFVVFIFGITPAVLKGLGEQTCDESDLREANMRRAENATSKEIKMSLKEYFEHTTGIGVLSTADKQGKVDAAIYARPHVMEDRTIAFIMTDRLTYKNVQSNPHAIYLFKEHGPGWDGKRLVLTKVKEERDQKRINSLRRRSYSPEEEESMKPLYLVYFRVDKERPLVGSIH